MLRLEYLKEVPISSNNSFSAQLKKTSKLGWPVSGFQDELDRNAGMVLKFSEDSFLKCHLILICRQNLSQSFLNSSSFNQSYFG